jgi:hypothetical protein
MPFEEVSFIGESLDAAHPDLERLPSELAALLASANGLVAFRGGFHLRGLVADPEWHSLRAAWDGPAAIHRLFPAVRPTDIPFAQDALGDQLVLRADVVWRLSAETGELASLGLPLGKFLQELQADPDGTLGLEPLRRFERDGGTLAPGELLNVYPPFVFTTTGPTDRSFRAISAIEQVSYLAHIAAQLADVSDGANVEIKILPRDG